jgi:hypothetical protein
VITRRREAGQWLVFVAICLLAVAIAYGLAAQTLAGSSDCACTQAPPTAEDTSSG